MTGDLPEGWLAVSVGDVVTQLKYGTAKKCSHEKRGVPVLRIPNVVSGVIDHADLKYAALPSAELEGLSLCSGDILVIRSNGSVSLVGRSAIVRDNERGFAFAGYLIRLRPTKAVVPEYLNLALGSFNTRVQIELEARSTSGVNNINAEEIRALPLSLAPLAEQRRVVAAMEKYTAKSEACRKRLDRIPNIFGRFRQAVLAAACDGRLTADWRIERNLVDDGDVPGGWGTSSVDDVCEKVVDCPHSTPKWTSTGFVCVKTTQLRPGKLDLTLPFYVSRETYKERTSRLQPQANDVLYCREGAVGAACLIPSGVQLCLGQRIMLMRAAKDVDPAFLMHSLNSEQTLVQARELTLGTTAQHVNVGDVKRFQLALPPPPEQKEIVARVNAMFALCDRLERRYNKARAQFDRLAQSILARAFRGELVLTEAELARREGRTYETAEELLARIRRDGDGQDGRRERVGIRSRAGT